MKSIWQQRFKKIEKKKCEKMSINCSMLFAEKKTNTQQILGIVAFIKTIKYRRTNVSSSSSPPQPKTENRKR